MTANFYGAICGWTTCFLMTTLVSLVTPKKPPAELAGLIYQSRHQAGDPDRSRMKQAWFFAGMIAVAGIILNWIFY